MVDAGEVHFNLLIYMRGRLRLLAPGPDGEPIVHSANTGQFLVRTRCGKQVLTRDLGSLAYRPFISGFLVVVRCLLSGGNV